MPFQPPNQRPPQTRVLDCLMWNLMQISRDVDRGDGFGYYTKGIIVDRNRDPRIARQNKEEQYIETPCMVSLRAGDEQLDSQFGPRKRYRRTVELWTLQSMTRQEDDQDGVTLDMLPARLRDDIVWRLDRDMGLVQATAALNDPDCLLLGPKFVNGMFGATPPCCIDLRVDGVVADKLNRFPDVVSVITLTYQSDEWRPGAVVADVPPPLP